MDKLDKINEDIDKINKEIDRLLNEQFEFWPTKLAKWLAKKTINDYGPKSLEYLKNIGHDIEDTIDDPEKNIKKIYDDYIDKQSTEDITKVDDVDIEVDDEGAKRRKELIKKLEDQLKKSEEVTKNIGTVQDSNLDDEDKNVVFKDSYSEPYTKIRINFRGVNDLSVQIGGGQEFKQQLLGPTDFDIQTIKKTKIGYIMRLHNRYFDDDIDLLVYAKFLKDKPQTNKIQLVYKSGRFVGAPKDVTFEIMRIN